MKTEIEDIIRSTLVIQNKQSLELCAEKIVKYLDGKKCIHPYDNVIQDDFGIYICSNCNEKLSD